MKRIEYLWGTDHFSLGLTIAKPHKMTGYRLYVSIDIAFLSVWVYLFKTRGENMFA